MIFYLIGLSYFVFLLEGMIKQNHRKIICYLYPFSLCIPLQSLFQNGKFFTIYAIILSISFLIIFYDTVLKNRFTFFAFTLVIIAFFLSEYMLIDNYEPISFSIISLALLILSKETKLWVLIISGLVLILLPMTFSSNENLYFQPFNYHTIFIPKLLFLTALLFWGILLPFSIAVLKNKSSVLTMLLIILIPLFCILHTMNFFTNLSVETTKLSQLYDLLALRFRIILLCFSFLPLILLLKELSIFKSLTSIFIIQFSFIFLLTTIPESRNNILFQTALVITTTALLSFSYFLFSGKKHLLGFVILSLCFSSLFIPIHILLYLNTLTPSTFFQLIILLGLLWKSFKLLLLTRNPLLTNTSN